MAGASVRPEDMSDSETESEYERGAVRQCCGCSCCGRIYRHIAEQRVHGYQVSVDLRFSVSILLVIAIGMLVGGAIMLAEALSQHEVIATYSADGPLQGLGDPQRAAVMRGEDVEGVSLPLTSTLEVDIDTDLSAPIYVYYILDGYHQNHRRYARSVSYPQLHGNEESPAAECDPQSELDVNGNLQQLPNNGRINPCGLQAWSTFNDSFTSFSVLRGGSGGTPESIALDESQLVFDSDRGFFFAPVEPTNLNTIDRLRGGREVGGPLDGDEDFMAWMRPYSKPNVQKFKGIIDEDISSGDTLLVEINHRYNTYDFGGKKRLLLTTQGPLGGRNVAFGVIWLVFGAFFLAATILYAVRGNRQLKGWHERRLWLENRWAHENSKPVSTSSIASSHTNHTW